MRINFWWVLFLIAAVFYFLFLIREDIMQNGDLVKEKQYYTRKLEEASKDNKDLVLSLSKIKTGKVVEKLARERLNLIKKGEIAFKVCQ